MFFFNQILTDSTSWRLYQNCSTSTKYWHPSTSWKLYQRLFNFYQILTVFNKLEIMSEVVLLLQDTDSLQQVGDYVRGCSTSTKYWLLQQIEDYARGCFTSTKTWQPSTSWRLCQRLFYLYQILKSSTSWDYAKGCSTSIKYWLLQQVGDYVRGCSTSTKNWQPSTSWRFCQIVLPLPNTDSLQQVGGYVRGCSTSSKLTAFNKLEIMSDIVLPLQDTDRFNQLKIMSEGYMGNKISVNILISLFLNLVDPIYSTVKPV